MVYAAARDLAENAADADRLHALLRRPTGGASASRRATAMPRSSAPGCRSAAPRCCRCLEEAAATTEPPELSESQIRIIRNRDAIVESCARSAPKAAGACSTSTSDRVVVITADTLEEARNAYASTQTRGLRQSETDKLKAELIGDAPRRARAAGRAWEECEAKLGRDDFAELFQHLVVIEGERRPQHSLEADLFRVFNLPRNVAAFIETVLVPSADAYVRICKAGEDATRKQRKISGALVSLLRCTHAALEGAGPAGAAPVRRRAAPARGIPGRPGASGGRADDHRRRPAPDPGALRCGHPRHQDEGVRRRLAAPRRQGPRGRPGNLQGPRSPCATASACRCC